MTDHTEPSTPHVLIVDDNAEIREILHILLTGEGFAVSEAADGTSALNLITQTSFDCIILDVMMPGLDGYHTCLAIRERTNAPILFLSAKTQERDKVLGFASGGDDYLAKPFSYNELMSRVKALIRRYHVYQGNAAPLPHPIYQIGNIVIDEQHHHVKKESRHSPSPIWNTPFFSCLSNIAGKFSLPVIFMKQFGKNPTTMVPTTR